MLCQLRVPHLQLNCLSWEKGGGFVNMWTLECEHWQQIHKNTSGLFIWGKIAVCVWKCVLQDETVCMCVSVCPSGVCNLCCLCLLPGCDAEGGCDGNLPLFKSTAGTSKPASAAGITEIIRHKRLIYIKMLINLFSLSPVRQKWPCVLCICLCDLCVWRLKYVFFFWSVMNEESEALTEAFTPFFSISFSLYIS